MKETNNGENLTKRLQNDLDWDDQEIEKYEKKLGITKGD